MDGITIFVIIFSFIVSTIIAVLLYSDLRTEIFYLRGEIEYFSEKLKLKMDKRIRRKVKK